MALAPHSLQAGATFFTLEGSAASEVDGSTFNAFFIHEAMPARVT
jgi:hypothetical protein